MEKSSEPSMLLIALRQAGLISCKRLVKEMASLNFVMKNSAPEEIQIVSTSFVLIWFN